METQKHSYESDGVSLRYWTAGTGPDLVLLHPTPVHHEFWLPVAGELARRYRVTMPDFRGHGASELGENGITVPQLGADIERLMDVAGIEHALFAGCSIGSYVLYELWRRMPDRMDALAFCCGKPQADTPEQRHKRQDTIARVQREGVAAVFDGFRETLVGRTCRERNPERADAARAMMNSTSPEAIIAVQSGLAGRPDSVETLQTIIVPVLALAGGEDALSSPEDMMAIADRVPSAAFHVMEDAGHFAPLEQPERVAGLLQTFFAAHAA